MISMLHDVFLPGHAWVDTVGWTLLHFCWQAALAALLYAGYRAFAGRSEGRGAQASYTMAVTLLVVLLLAPVVTFSGLAVDTGLQPVAPLARLAAIPDALPDSGAEPFPIPLAWTSYAFTLWVLGVACFALRFALGLGHWQWIHRAAQPLLDDDKLRLILRIAQRLELRTSLHFRVSARIPSPVVIGFFRYTLMLPVAFFNSLTAAQVEAILAHELAHVRRRDGLVNLMQAVAETLFFFHPAVWWLSREIRREREKACDMLAAGIVGDRTRYAEALLALEELRPADGALVLGARRGSLEERIRHLLGAEDSDSYGSAWTGAGLLLAAFLLGGSLWAVTGAQQDAPLPPSPPDAPVAPAAARGRDFQPVVAPAPLPYPKPKKPIQPAPAPVPSAAEAPDSASAAPPAPAIAATPAASPAPAVPPVSATPRVPTVTLAPAPVALVRPAQAPASPRPGTQLALTDAQRQERMDALRRDLAEGAYKRWVLEDVAYIIRDEELAAFHRLTIDEEREKFIEQFWLRRDPSPGTEANEAKEEHYRRIAWANGRLGRGSTPGWRTEQGRIYIQFGPPDEIEDHPPAGSQRWFYREIRGIGNNISFEFGTRPPGIF
ncbi:MAG: GWxTD domain-containing protein [Bryobacterales bacterium]|nr:GWxTD domain-containing protein [Bryobacterales bacterium]